MQPATPEASAARGEPRRRQVHSPTDPAVTLSVREYGDPAGATHLVFLHGFPDDQHLWDGVLDALSSGPETDWHLITYDTRGAGDSSQPREQSAYRCAALVEDFVAVLDATVPTSRSGAGVGVHLVGHDWGSMAGWEVIAAETRDPRLSGRLASFTSCSGPSLDHLGTLASTRSGRRRLRRQWRRSWYVVLFQVPWLPEFLWGRLQGPLRSLLRRTDPSTDLLPWGGRLRHNTARSIHLYRANLPHRLRHPVAWRTTVPVQVIVATRDAYVTPEVAHDLELRCTALTRVELDAGHWVPRSDPDRFAAAVRDFVATR